jgi:hypothetical protein
MSRNVAIGVNARSRRWKQLRKASRAFTDNGSVRGPGYNPPYHTRSGQARSPLAWWLQRNAWRRERNALVAVVSLRHTSAYPLAGCASGGTPLDAGSRGTSRCPGRRSCPRRRKGAGAGDRPLPVIQVAGPSAIIWSPHFVCFYLSQMTRLEPPRTPSCFPPTRSGTLQEPASTMPTVAANTIARGRVTE